MREILLLILKQTKYYRGSLAIVFVCSLLSMGEAFLRPLIIRRLTDDGMLQMNYQIVLTFSVVLIMLIVLVQAMEIVQNQKLFDIKQGVIHRLSVQAFDKLLHLKISYFTDQNSAQIINQLNTDIECAGILMDRGVIYMFNYCLRIFTGLLGLFFINWKMALCILGCIPIKMVLLHIISEKKEKMTEISIRKNRFLHSWMSDRIMGIQEVKLLGRYKKDVKQFSEKRAETLECERKSGLLETYNTSAETLVYGIMTVIFYLFGGYFVCRGEMSVGSVLAFISYSGNVTGPISMVMNLKMIVAQIRPSFERLKDFWELDEEANIAGILAEPIKELQADHLSFSFADRELIKDVSFSMQKGEKIAIVGENGSGKSTLLNLLLRFYVPKTGKLFINKRDAAEIELEQYRTNFSVVSQFPYLFQDTVRENLDPNNCYTDKEILETFHRFQMQDLLKRLPKGLETIIGVNGANLSGGERQKLAFLRAVLKKSSVLILDECTSNYDQESENWLYSEGLNLLQDRIIIFVTHQPQYLKYFHKIYHLENGTVFIETKV